jgi:phage-related baseplate assembly protein
MDSAMTRYAATAINLSALGPPPVVQVLPFEDILAQLKADLVERWPDFNVGTLESDPVVKVLEVVAYREVQLRARVNDAARAVMLSESTGGDLEHLSALYGVIRQTGETNDEALRFRTQIAPEGFSSAGPRGAYIFHALSATSDVLDADAVKYFDTLGRVQVHVYIIPRAGSDVATVLQAVRTRLAKENIGPLTDDVAVLAATPVAFNVEAVLEIGRGPSPSVVVQNAQTALNKYLAERRKIGVRATVSGITAALSVGGVEKVRLASPLADIDPADGGYPEPGTITITSEAAQ